MSWAEVARHVFALAGHDANRVTEVSTAEYFSNASIPMAPRPRNSALDLAKTRAAGYSPAEALDTLRHYLMRKVLAEQ